MGLRCAWSMHAASVGVGANVANVPCGMLRMINGCDKAARPWRRRTARGVPSGGDGVARPSGATAHGDPGRARPLALCAIPSGPGILVGSGLIRSKPPSWRTWLPGIPPHSRPSASTKAPRACARHRFPPPRAGNAGLAPRCAASCGRPPSTGGAYRGRSQPVPARRRHSALPPVGSSQWQQPAPMEAGRAMPVPALMSPATCEAAQHRVERHGQRARRHKTAHASFLRGLVSGAQCRLTGAGRTRTPGSHDDGGQGRAEARRAARGDRCTAR